MKAPLIEKVEINYFRSLYKENLGKCQPLSIIVGGNDSGKSNVLRAINLFFNNCSGLNEPYDFGKDLSLYRLRQTQGEGERKAFLSIKITFNNIFHYSSLPEKFAVKKQWNRYTDIPDSYYFPNELGEKHKYIQRFLNRIHVDYVPAIKGKDIFGFYLKALHDTLAQKNILFSDATKKLTDVVNEATKTMAAQIRDGIGIESNIAAPKDFRDLFGDLDFSTRNEGEAFLSLRQRGDGVQVSHIPYILDFIARESNEKFFIWLYEEPENSLELKRCFELADDFANNFSERNQIFLTTHSPAFYSLSGEKISKWSVHKEIEQLEKSNFSLSKITELGDLKAMDEGLGITALVAERARDVYEEKKRLEQKIEKLSASNKPLVLCEGKTDVSYLKKAIELFEKSELLEKCNIVEINQDGMGSGCTELQKVLKDRQKRSLLYSSPMLFVFDCDVPNPGQESGNCYIYKFSKQNNSPFLVGIENSLSTSVAGAINDDEEYWNTEETNYGHKQVTIRQLNKTKACSFVCRRNSKDDFSLFANVIDAIERLVQ